VHDFLGVAVVNGLQELLHDLGCYVLVEVLRFQDQVKHFPAFKVFGDHVDVAGVRVHFIELHNVWVV